MPTSTAAAINIKLHAATGELYEDLTKAKSAIKDFGKAGVTETRATRSAFSALHGDILSNQYAAEQFAEKLLHMGDLAKAAFPIIGGLAFIGILTEAGSKLVEFFKKIQDAPQTITKAFKNLSEPIQSANAEMQVANDKLQNEIDKLEGRRENKFKLMLDEATAAAIKLGQELDKDLDKISEELTKANTSAIMQPLLGEGTGAGLELVKGFQEDLQGLKLEHIKHLADAQKNSDEKQKEHAIELENDRYAQVKVIRAQQYADESRDLYNQERDRKVMIKDRIHGGPDIAVSSTNPATLAAYGGLAHSAADIAARTNMEAVQSRLQGTLGSDQDAKAAADAAAKAQEEAERERQQIDHLRLEAIRKNQASLEKAASLQDEINGGTKDAYQKMFHALHGTTLSVHNVGEFFAANGAGPDFLTEQIDPRLANKLNLPPQLQAQMLDQARQKGIQETTDQLIKDAEGMNKIVEESLRTNRPPIGTNSAMDRGGGFAGASDASIGPGKKAIELAQHVMGTHGADLAIMKQAEEILQKQLITGKDIEGNVVSQRETSLALYNLDKERLQLQIRMAEEQDTLKGSLAAFFDEMNLQSRNSGKILTAELSKAVDDSSKILADMATGEYKKGDLSKSVRSISHDMLQSSIKNAMQRGLGTMGGKLDGSTPATAPWVRVANALQAAGAQIGPSGMGWGVGGAGASNEGSGGFSPFGGGLELGGAPGAPDASSQSRVRRLLSSFLNQGSAAQSPLGKFLPGFLGGAPKVSESLPAGMGDAAGATADMSSTISDMMAAAPALAGGGDVNPSAAYTWVGEQGPELLARGSSGHVFSNSDSTKILAGSGGDTFHIDARGSDPALVDSKVRRSVAAAHQSAVSVAHATARQQARRTPQ